MKKGSLIIVLRYVSLPYFADIVAIDLNELPEEPTVVREPYTGPVIPPPPFKSIARLKQGGENKLLEHIDWKICSLSAAQTGGGVGCSRSSSSSITPGPMDLLCVFPNSGPGAFRKDTPLCGYIFNFRTGAMERLKPPKTPKLAAYLVSLKGDIFSFSNPSYLPTEPDCVPERYSLEKKSWKSLEPFPSESGKPDHVIGYAVFDDFVLFNMRNSRRLLAYDCISEKWHVVTVHDRDRECYGFQGLGVVVGATLYALTHMSRSIVALSITREQSDHGDVVGFTGCFQSRFMMYDTIDRNYWVDEPQGNDHLVHFGGLEFCLVRTGFCNNDYINQELKIMVVKLQESKNMVVELQESENLATLIHAMDYEITLGVDFSLSHCFLLPPDLDLGVSKQEDGSDIYSAFDIQNVNPAPEAETATLPKEETIGVSVDDGRRKKGDSCKKKSSKSKSPGGRKSEGSRSQMSSK